MTQQNKNLLNFSEASLVKEFSLSYGKGLYHAQKVIEHAYSKGSLAELDQCEAFQNQKTLAMKIMNDYAFTLPEISSMQEEDGTIKFTLTLHDGYKIESVIIPMKEYTSLCVSSQVGCARGCAFCRTSRMGLVRNLQTHEIIEQYMVARFILKKDIRNIVFMGMGEPLDNLDSVLEAIDILCDFHGINIPARKISISTCGQCQGLLELKKRAEQENGANFRLLVLSLSLHSLQNTVRDTIMPVNKIWPIEKLTETLHAMPQAKAKKKIFIEYLIIPSINNSKTDADALGLFVQEFDAKVNLIAFNAPEDSIYTSANAEDVNRFWSYLRSKNIICFSRASKGACIQAACGQLATQ